MFHAAGGREAALTEIRLRAGRWFHPALVETFEAVADDAFWTMLASPEVTSAVLALDTDFIAETLGLSPTRRRWLERGALLHDVGKLGVSISVTAL